MAHEDALTIHSASAVINGVHIHSDEKVVRVGHDSVLKGPFTLSEGWRLEVRD
jgi:nitrogen fixation protein